MGKKVPDRRIPWSEPQVSSINDGILYALSYADVYDYPLTIPQLHRYLVGIPATVDEVTALVEDSTWALKHIGYSDGYYMLPGREHLAIIRQHRRAIAEKLWIRARHFAYLISRIPFVRMVALTGALTMNNVEDGDDYDYLIITEKNHLWLTRFLIVQLIVKPAMLKDEEVCPNYIVTDRALTLDTRENDLYHAHELAQMVPMYGLRLYQLFRDANMWSNKFLPNATGMPSVTHKMWLQGKPQSLVLEKLLHFASGNWFERWEMSRMAKKLGVSAHQDEVLVTPDQCKGHVGAHQNLTREAFEARISTL